MRDRPALKWIRTGDRSRYNFRNNFREFTNTHLDYRVRRRESDLCPCDANYRKLNSLKLDPDFDYPDWNLIPRRGLRRILRDERCVTCLLSTTQSRQVSLSRDCNSGVSFQRRKWIIDVQCKTVSLLQVSVRVRAVRHIVATPSRFFHWNGTAFQTIRNCRPTFSNFVTSRFSTEHVKEPALTSH